MTRRTTYNEEQLTGLLKLNNRVAYEYLYDRYSPALFGIIHKIVKNDELACDVMQDAFLKIWRSIHTYDKSKGTLFTWILNVARNTAIDKLRTESRSTLVVPLDSLAEQHVPATEVQSVRHTEMDLRGIVDQLNPERREVIELVYFQGYTHEEVSKNLGLPLGTVKSRVRKALQELRSYFTFYNMGLEAA